MPDPRGADRRDGLTGEALAAVVDLRHRLHAFPETGGSESDTAALLAEFLGRLKPDRLFTGVGGKGLTVLFEAPSPGPTVAFRAEIDAVPVHEQTALPYRSKKPGLSHACGHDGHAAILAGLALLLAANRPARGRTVLLFQPAEETGEGARRMLEDPSFAAWAPEWCFALHNLPGVALGTVLVKPGVFACASVGLRVALRGASSHAAHPEEARSPAPVIARLLEELPRIPQGFEFFSLLTVTHARLGEPGFGVTPGEAELCLTLRAAGDEPLKHLSSAVRERIFALAREAGLEVSITLREPFPALVNRPEAAALVERAAQDLGLEVAAPPVPFRWSEDFGHFTARSRGAMFGLGAGLSAPPLHSPGYDFADALLPLGVRLLDRIRVRLTEV